MSLIDYTYFIGEINVPNVSQQTDVLSKLNHFIGKYEKDILIKLLGYTLYKAFTSGLEDVSPAQKWLDIRDGKEYQITKDGKEYTVKWNGLINSDKQSLIANYVYYHIILDELTFNTGLGIASPNQENADKSLAFNKMSSAFNGFVDLYGNKASNQYGSDAFISGYKYENRPFRYDNPDDYDFNTDLQPTAYNFIKHQNDLYGDDYYDKWIFTPIKPINSIGI